MKKLVLLFPFIFLTACGGGKSGSNDFESLTGVISLYSGKKTPAQIDQSNYLEFVRIIFGNNSEVPNTALPRGTKSIKPIQSDTLSKKVNSMLMGSLSSINSLSSQMPQRSVSEIGFCQEGTSEITGDVNDVLLTGRLVSKYNNCMNGGITLNGTITLEILKYNIDYDRLEHYTLNYRGLQITENDYFYTSSGDSEVKIDPIKNEVVTVDNILIVDDKELLFENFTTIETFLGVTTITGNIYLEDHGYVVISTQSPLVNTRYAGGIEYPSTGGPIQIEGSNQTLDIYPQEQGNVLQIEYLNDSGQRVREGFIDTDFYGPELVSLRPTTDSIDVPLNSSIELEFDESLDPNAIKIDENFLRTIRNSFYKWVPTTTSVSGNKLTITPVEPLKYGERYEISLGWYESNSVIKDIQGNYTSFSEHDDLWSFKTVEFGEKVELGFEIDLDSFELDKSTNKLYTVDKENMELVVINLTTDVVEQTLPLSKLPSRMCVDSASDRLYFTSMGSPFVEEYRISDSQHIASISWPAAERLSDDPHTTGYHGNDFDIQCKNNELLVVDASWTSQLYSINRKSPYAILPIVGVDHIGEFYIASSGHIYTWYKDFSGDIKAMEYYPHVSFDGSFVSDESTFIYRHRRDIPDNKAKDAPIFVDEIRDIVINERYVFNRHDLSSVLHDFGENKVIYSTDFVRNRVSALNEVYSTDDYSNIFTIPMHDADETLFDNEGDLYIIKNKNSSLYRIKESDM